MASVYLVTHRVLGSKHVLKVLNVGGRSLAERLTEEGRVQATLEHPNVVAVTDIVDIDGDPGLIMTYVRGPSLEDLLQSRRLGAKEVERLLPRILAGVQAAHALGIVHRDLKPGNVMLAIEAGGVVPKVADFGLAKRTEGGMSKTRSGATLGTPQYLAPEQIRGADKVDARADVWSLGVMVQEMLTGQPLFDADNVYDILTLVEQLDFVGLEALRPELPDAWLSAVAGALKPLDQRWESVDAFWSAWDASGRGLEEASLGPAEWDVDALLPLVPAAPEGAEPSATVASNASVGPATWTGSEPTASDVELPAAPAVAPLPRGSEAPARRFLPLLAVSATAAVAVVAIGLVAAGVGLSMWPVDDAPLALPVPAAPAPVVAPASRPPPQPSLPTPAPEKVVPSAAPPSAPAPAPAPAPSPSTVRPVERPSPAGASGTWSLSWSPGGEGSGTLVGSGGTFPPGPLPPGEYALRVEWPDRDGSEDMLTITVKAGEGVAVICSAILNSCRSVG